MAIKKLKVSIEPPKPRRKCLLLVPRSEHSDAVSKVVRSVLMESGVSPVSFEDRMQVGALWVDGIMASLREADFLIADVTGRNANVLFELGIAHGLGKPFVLLVSVAGNGDIPSDLMGYQYISYDPTNILVLHSRLNRFVQHVVERLERT